MVVLASSRPMLAVVCTLLLLVAVGCGQSEFNLVPVSGVVTLDGEPLPEARVAFEPMSTSGGDPLAIGPGSYGETDATGRYELVSIDDDPGAVVGTHRVRISTYLAELDPSRTKQNVLSAEKIPAHYRGQQSLQFQVPAGGTEAANFALATKPTGEAKSE